MNSSRPQGPAQSNANTIAYVVIALSLCAFATLRLKAAPAPEAGTTTVFRLGKFDRSSTEFSEGEPKQKVNFIVSRGDPAKDWYAHHPVARPTATDGQDSKLPSAPRSITFAIEGSPAAEYRLHVSILLETPIVPALKVSINGRTGVFYLHPKLEYESDDAMELYDPAFSSADVESCFPGSYCRGGDNIIALEPVTELREIVPNAGLTYDAIELDSVPNNGDAVSARLEPTIFFQQKNGKLEERVDAFVRYGDKVAPGSAELTIGGERYHLAMRAAEEFGEEKLSVFVPEFEPKTAAALLLDIRGRKFEFNQSINPARKWTVLIVPSMHLDVGYTDFPAKVAAVQGRSIDEALDMAAAHKDFRYSIDGEWALQQYLETRSDAEKMRLIEAVRAHQIFVPAQYAHLNTGNASTELLIRSLYPSANFSREHGTPLDYANITDVPCWSWSYASVLASAGIPYLAGGSNNYMAPVLLQGRLHECSPMWWEGPDGKRVLLWYSRHYRQLKSLFGSPAVTSAGTDTLPLFLQTYSRDSYRASTTIVYGTQLENTDLFPQQAEVAGEWNAVYAYPHLEYAGFGDAIERVAEQFGGNLPTIRGDGGPYWDLSAGTEAIHFAIERTNEARGLTAEKLTTLTSLVDARLKADPAELGKMWNTMVLMNEHINAGDTIFSASRAEAVNQRAMKEQFAINAAAEVDWLTRRSMANLGDVIQTGPHSLIVFNSLNWRRSAPVEMDLDEGYKIVDKGTNQPIPFEVIGADGDSSRIRFIAQDVPSVGYKCYEIKPSNKVATPPSAEQRTTLESPYYKVQLDPDTGSVRSIYDKQLGRELVNQESPYRFGEYLYVAGGDETPNTLVSYARHAPRANLTIHPAEGGRIESVVRTPLGETARMVSRSVNTPSIETTILLFNGEKKIEFVEEFEKNAVRSREAVYFVFPFAVSHPQFRYEIQNGVIDPATDTYPGAGHEWFSAQHWVSVAQSGVAATLMPLDAPVVTLGDVDRGLWPETFGERPATIFSFVMNNYWAGGVGPISQGGHFAFHYVITSDDEIRAGNLSRMGWEEATPLESNIVTDLDKAVIPFGLQKARVTPSLTDKTAENNARPELDGKQASFLDISDEDVALLTWKPAEDRRGTILRFLDLGGKERTVSVSSSLFRLVGVWQTDALERGGSAVAIDGPSRFHFTIHPHEIVTIRVVGTAAFDGRREE